MSIVWITLLLWPATAVHATTYIIMFGGSLGDAYSPKSLNASVGDTIQWEGDFSVHPLSSTSVPAGAASFHHTSGGIFAYHITVAGTYQYQCDVHASLGMTGSFTALVTGIEDSRASLRPGAFKLDQNYPNPFNPTTMISFDLPFQSFVSIKVYNLVGQEVATIVNENMPAGSYARIWNAASVPSGVYFYRLQARAIADGRGSTFTETRRLIVLK
jgi:plastocyanin